jgi:hypothetical protein
LATPFAQNSSILLQDTGTDGRYTVNASINGVGVKTYYTAENWFASLSSTTYLFLYENGYIDPSDVKGFATLKMPNGSSEKAASFVIKELRHRQRDPERRACIRAEEAGQCRSLLGIPPSTELEAPCSKAAG